MEDSPATDRWLRRCKCIKRFVAITLGKRGSQTGLCIAEYSPTGRLAAYFLLEDAAVRQLAKGGIRNTDDRTLLEYHGPKSFLAAQLANPNVSQLERIATALFVTLDANVHPGSQEARLIALKPHIPKNEAPLAFQRLGVIRDAAIAAGLVYISPALALTAN